MARTRCTSAGCSRFALRGHIVCSKHLRHPGLIVSQPHTNGRDYADRSDFQQRLERVDSYRDLLGPKLTRIMREAGQESGLTDEIGLLRLVMARVIDEEPDPVRLANAVSRLATVAVQAMRAQRVLTGQMADTLTDALTQILLELDATETP